MNLCPLRVLCSHRPRIIERLFLIVIFLYISRFGQALSSLFHVYVCIYIVPFSCAYAYAYAYLACVMLIAQVGTRL